MSVDVSPDRRFEPCLRRRLTDAHHCSPLRLNQRTFLSLLELSCRARLIPATGFQSEMKQASDGRPLLTGDYDQSGFVAQVFPPREQCFFIFSELSVRAKGLYRLRIDIIDHSSFSFTNLGAIYSDVFEVHDRKAFPGLTPSTDLVVAIVRRGLKLRLVKSSGDKKSPSQASHQKRMCNDPVAMDGLVTPSSSPSSPSASSASSARSVFPSGQLVASTAGPRLTAVSDVRSPGAMLEVPNHYGFTRSASPLPSGSSFPASSSSSIFHSDPAKYRKPNRMEDGNDRSLSTGEDRFGTLLSLKRRREQAEKDDGMVQSPMRTPPSLHAFLNEGEYQPEHGAGDTQSASMAPARFTPGFGGRFKQRSSTVSSPQLTNSESAMAPPPLPSRFTDARNKDRRLYDGSAETPAAPKTVSGLTASPDSVLRRTSPSPPSYGTGPGRRYDSTQRSKGLHLSPRQEDSCWMQRPPSETLGGRHKALSLSSGNKDGCMTERSEGRSTHEANRSSVKLPSIHHIFDAVDSKDPRQRGPPSLDQPRTEDASPYPPPHHLYASSQDQHTPFRPADDDDRCNDSPQRPYWPRPIRRSSDIPYHRTPQHDDDRRAVGPMRQW